MHKVTLDSQPSCVNVPSWKSHYESIAPGLRGWEVRQSLKKKQQRHGQTLANHDPRLVNATLYGVLKKT